MEVMKRFELVGGRIRLLLHNYTGFSQLKEQVLKSVYAVSAKDLEQLDCLDLHHHAPSIIYSFVPNDILTNPKKYRLHFASDYIAKHVASRIVLHFKGEINNLFAALKDQKVGGSLVGQIFEYLVLEALQSGKIRYISGTRLRPTPPLMDSEPDVTIEFGAIDILKYNVSSRDLRRLISGGARLNKLLLPIQLNAPSVDAVFYNAQTRRYYFIQITISIDHPINYLQIAKLANALGVTNYTLIDIIYLVPQNVYYNFKIQKVANAPARGYTGFNQYVFRVADINNAGLSILNYVSSN